MPAANHQPWSRGVGFWQDLWRTRTYRLFPAIFIYVACALPGCQQETLVVAQPPPATCS